MTADLGADKVLQEAFQYSPTTAFSFIVAILVMAVTVLTYAIVYLYKEGSKQNAVIAEAYDRDRQSLYDMMTESKDSSNSLTRSLENNSRMLTEACDRDKELITNQRTIIDLIKEMKR